MNKVEKIKAEIERLIKAYSPIQSTEGKYRVEAYKDLISFIDSIQEDPVSNDLEEASVNYAATGLFLPNGKEMIDFQVEKAFKAGAQWQKEQMGEETCKWLELHDSYAVPTNIKVRDLKEHLSSK